MTEEERAQSHLGSITVAATGGLLVVVLKVGTGEEMAKDKLGDVAPVLLVLDDRNTLSVVLNGDGVARGINGDVELVHGLVTLLVVTGVDEDLIKDLEEARNEGDLLLLDALALGINNENGILHGLSGTNVGVRTQEDVLELSLLLVSLLNSLLAALKGGTREGKG
jgi:hypothetical protein